MLKKELESLDDASTELMMGSGEKVMLLLGGAFFETNEDEATEHCEGLVEKMQAQIDELNNEEESILERQAGFLVTS